MPTATSCSTTADDAGASRIALLLDEFRDLPVDVVKRATGSSEAIRAPALLLDVVTASPRTVR